MSRARVVAILVFFAVFAAGCSRTSSQPPGKDAVPGAPGNIEGRSQWVRTAGKYGSSNTWSSPFQANISAKGREGIDVGEDVEVTVSLYNVTGVPSSREVPRALEVMEYAPTVAVFPAAGSIDSPIWQETFPSLSGVLEPGDGYELNFTWKQVDFSGGQVPPGYYYVELKSGSVRYRDDGREKTQALEWSMHTSHSEVQINHPEGTTVSGGGDAALGEGTGPEVSGVSDEPSLVKQITVDGWMWTANPWQAISPRGDYALMVRKAASCDAVNAVPLGAGDDEIITLHTADAGWIREHSPEYDPEHYPVGWIDDSRCLFVIHGHQSTGPHKGERGVSIRVGDVNLASSIEMAFIPLAEGVFKSGRLVPEKGKAYLHVTAAIWEYDVEKGGLRAVRTGMPTYDGLFWPRLSPDGRYYAYDLHEQHGNGVHVLDADTGKERPLLLNGETASFYPSWSPDGRYVAAYTSRLKKGASPRPGYPEESAIYNMLPDEDGPQPVSDCITVARPDGTIVRTVEVKGKMLIGFVAGTVARVPGKSQEERGGMEFGPDSVWIARVAGGEGTGTQGAGAEGAGTGDDPVCLADIEPAAPGEDRLFTVAAVEPDGKGVLCLDWPNDTWSLIRTRMGDPPGASLKVDGRVAGGGVCPVFGDSIAALVENRESVAVWVFGPLGAKEIARFKPEGSVWVCGYNDDTLVVTTDGKQGEGSVVRVYRMPR
ncbi:MAG: TolB family protein [Ignavibacteriales bacterium]